MALSKAAVLEDQYTFSLFPDAPFCGPVITDKQRSEAKKELEKQFLQVFCGPVLENKPNRNKREFVTSSMFEDPSSEDLRKLKSIGQYKDDLYIKNQFGEELFNTRLHTLETKSDEEMYQCEDWSDEDVVKLCQGILKSSIHNIKDCRTSPYLWQDLYDWVSKPILDNDADSLQYPFSFQMICYVCEYEPYHLQEQLLWILRHDKDDRGISLSV